MARDQNSWQSKAVLLLVLPFAGVHLLLAGFGYAQSLPSIAVWTLGLSALLGLAIGVLRAATPAAAATGAVIVASLMFSTIAFPFAPWRTALIPTLGVTLLASAATRVGRRKKELLGIAEGRRGRRAAQVAANLGFAALVASAPVQIWLLNARWLPLSLVGGQMPLLSWALALAALAEAAADTVSSEIGQVFGGRPRLITTWRAVDPGHDGAVTLVGTLAGLLAAAAIAAAGAWALRANPHLFWASFAGGAFGLFFDSLLGATLEDLGWLNNDAVNFLSTASASAFALAMLCVAA